MRLEKKTPPKEMGWLRRRALESLVAERAGADFVAARWKFFCTILEARWKVWARVGKFKGAPSTQSTEI